MFYLPLYFQSIHAQSAVTSGVNTLAFLAFFAVGAVTSGSAIGKTRLLVPYQLASALLMTAGMALLYRMDMDTSQAWYIGAQVLFGFGVGLGNQVPMTAVQGMAKPEDVSSSTAIMFSKYSVLYTPFLADSVTSVPIRQWRLLHRSGTVHLCQQHVEKHWGNRTPTQPSPGPGHWRIRNSSRLSG
jgi:hypothetical protein